jgi:hypothetical protein
MVISMDTGISPSQHTDSLVVSKYNLKNSLDSLNQYTYLMLGVYQGNIVKRMNCFFTRYGHKLYLVSTNSNFTGWTPLDSSKMGARLIPYPDTLALRVFRKSNHHCIYWNIDIREIKRNSIFSHFWHKPDIYLYKITDTNFEKEFDIRTIDSFAKQNRPDDGGPDEIYLAGFAPSKLTDGDYYHAVPAVYKNSVFGRFEDYLFYTNIRDPDSINYNIFLVFDNGLAGSPVFFRVSRPEGFEIKTFLTFGGVFLGNCRIDESGKAVRPRQVLQALDKDGKHSSK